MTTFKIPIYHKSKGVHFMLIDEEDFDLIKDLPLSLNYSSHPNTFYAKSIVYKDRKYVKRLNIHRLIMGLDDHKNDKRIINHIDGNGLNNRKENLEICDNLYNSQSINWKNVKCKCKNYYFENDSKRKMKWRAYITIFGKYHSKRFHTENECIKYIDSLQDQRNSKNI